MHATSSRDLILGRTPAEQLHALSVAAVALDCIFLLAFFGATLLSARESLKTRCYEEQGYRWHNALALSVFLSGTIAGAGLGVHSKIACARTSCELPCKELRHAATYAWALVSWIFVSGIVEAIAYRLEPAECAMLVEEGEEDATTLDSLWTVIYLFLSFAWLAVCVSCGVLSKRELGRTVPEAGPTLGQGADEESRSEPTPRGAAEMPQIVGVPVSDQGQRDGAAAPLFMVAQGSALASTDVVAQGKPCRHMPDPERPSPPLKPQQRCDPGT